MSNNNSDLKNHIAEQLALTESDDGTIDIADATRKWLEQQGILQIVVDAIKGKAKNEAGKVIEKDQLTLKERVNFALKLSNKMLPDLKASEQKTTISVDATVKHTATNNLLIEAGCFGDVLELSAENVDVG